MRQLAHLQQNVSTPFVLRSHQRRLRVSCSAEGTYSTGTRQAGPAPRSRRQQTRSPEEAQQLFRELTELATAAGPRGAFRGVQAAQAAVSIGVEYAQGLFTGVQDPPPVILRKLFERLGATYIKLGQFIASSPTLFPAEYVTEFQRCLDRTEPVPWEAIQQTIQSELQVPMDEVFSLVDPVPLATASVAQVHAAVLRGSNKDVVIKVLKPGVEDILNTDLSFLYASARILEFFNPELSRTSLVGVVSDIRKSMLQEVDFQQEARHIQDFSNYLDASGMRKSATCPFVYKLYSSRRVLVMERLYGVPLTDLAAIRSITSADPEATLTAALNTWFGSLLGCRTFHADVHAGNLLVLKDGRVGFIDFGIVGSISPVTWAAVESLVRSATINDFDLMARALVTMGMTDQQVDIPSFARDLEGIFAELQQIDPQMIASRQEGGVSFAASMAADDSSVNRLLIQIVQAGEVHGIRFPREFGLLVKQMLYFDRYTRILAPEMSVLSNERINAARDQQDR